MYHDVLLTWVLCIKHRSTFFHFINWVLFLTSQSTFSSCYFLFLKPIIILSTIYICSLIMICCWQCSFRCTSFFSFHVYVHIHVGGGYCVYAGEFARVCAFMWRSKADLGFFLINLPQYSLSQCLSVKSKTWWYTYKLVQRISYFCFLMKLESQKAEHPFLEFNCVWRSKPWSLCLQDKHFNNWAISPGGGGARL